MLSQIVVGVDFGTTHSGVSWAVRTNPSAPHHIRLLTDWPNPHALNATADKVPTTLSYAPDGTGALHAWGYTATCPPSPASAAAAAAPPPLQWFKLLLERDPHPHANHSHHAATASALADLYAAHDPVALAADFLRCVWAYALADIARHQGPDWAEIYAVEAVLTVPAIWSAGARERTRRAARGAGMPEDLVLVAEPEAAALAVLGDRAEEGEGQGLRVGDAFVVCDAGGGTVDLISYRVKGLAPLRVEENAIGDGDLCGSVFIDRAFERYIAGVVGPELYKTSFSAKAKASMMREFEYSVKRVFTGEDGLYTVDLKGAGDDPENGIEDDTIILDVEMLRTIFDHVCDQVLTLVEKQVDSVLEQGSLVKAVLLVGGFGSSKYLYNYLSSADTLSSIRVLQSKNAWSAICRGATQWGLEHLDASAATVPHGVRTNKTVEARLSRYSYGVALSCVWDPAVHDERDRYLDEAEGVYRARNQMRWLLKRGQKVRDGAELTTSLYETVQVGFWDSGVVNFSRVLYVCDEDVPPLRRDETVVRLCSVAYAIPCNELWMEKSYKSRITKQKYRDATFKMVVRMGCANVDFEVYYSNKLAAFCQAKYLEDV